MSDTARVLNKIKRLLALADGAASDGERLAALTQVQRLMLRYNLDAAAVEQADHTDDQFHEEFVDTYRRRTAWLDPILTLLAEFFFVQPFFEQRADDTKVMLFGEPHNVAVGAYVYCFLDRTFRDKWRARCRERRSRAGCRSYCLGMAAAIRETLLEEHRQAAGSGHALIRSNDDLMNGFRARYGDLRGLAAPNLQLDPLAAIDGHMDGQDVRIRKGIRAQPERQGHLFSAERPPP